MHSYSIKHLLAGLFLTLFGITGLHAQSRLISYQGEVFQNGVPLVGTHDLKINYYDSHGNFVGSEHDSTRLLNQGQFDYVLGHAFPGGQFPAAFTFNEDYSVGVSIDNGPELTPRTQLLSSPSSLYSQSAGAAPGVALSQNKPGVLDVNVDGGTIGVNVNNQLIVNTNAIGTPQLKNGAVTSAKIANGAIGLAQMDSTAIVNPASPTHWTSPQTFVAGATTTGFVIQDGHLTSKQATLPTMVVSNTANITAFSLANETDMGGKATITCSNSAIAGDYLQINFNKPYNSPPIVVISPAELGTATNFTKFYAGSTTTFFRIYLAAPIAGTYILYYMVMETQ